MQRIFSLRNKPKYRKHDFAFAGLLRCAHDGCTVTTELHKGKYIYYRCSYGRGKCDLPYMPEQKISDQLGKILKDIYLPEAVVEAIVRSIEDAQGSVEAKRLAQMSSLNQRLATIRSRMDQIYDDKLDGKIDEEFFLRKMNEWREQEGHLQASIEQLSAPAGASLLSAARNFRTREQGLFSVPYAQCGGTRPAAENGAFELRYRRRKSLACLQEALRFDPSTGQK